MSRSHWLLLTTLLLLAIDIGSAWSLWRHEPAGNTAQNRYDVILVLGSPCRKDGSPTPEQRARVLEGVREWRRGVAPKLVMSGAAAHNRWVEAQSMAQIAREQGVPAGDILQERQAYNTIQNVYYTVAIMQAHGWRSAEVVSSWSHLPRASRILAHFSIMWRTHAAPWPPEFGLFQKAMRSCIEAQYCLLLRVRGFTPSRFISRYTRPGGTPLP